MSRIIKGCTMNEIEKSRMSKLETLRAEVHGKRFYEVWEDGRIAWHGEAESSDDAKRKYIQQQHGEKA